MFKDINTVAVYVVDKEKAKKFYTEVLGFEFEADLGPNLCFLKSSNGKIHIYLEGGMSPGELDNWSVRLGFFLQSEKSAAETFAALKAAGVNLLNEQPEPVSDDTACFQFRDPDGNIIDACGAR